MRKKMSVLVFTLMLVFSTMFSLFTIKACAETTPPKEPKNVCESTAEQLPPIAAKQMAVFVKTVEEIDNELNENCEKGDTNKERLFNYLVYKGYSEEAAAGIIGNLMWESGGKTDIKLNAVERGSGEGVGMVQWSFGRKQNFIDYCDECGVGWPNESLKVQADFLLKELEGNEWLFAGGNFGYDSSLKLTFEEFKNCDDVSLATKAFCANFERCRAKHAHMESRISYAQSVLDSYGN